MAWLVGYTRRKIKVVENLPTGIPNYQMRLIIYKNGLGPDSPTQIYLGGNVRDDFRDIRFTWPDESTHLSYWIESYVSGNYAIVWVKVPTNINPTHIVIYYDNPIEAVSGSNGDTTFEFFDDFTSNSINQYTINGGSWSIDTSLKELQVIGISAGNAIIAPSIQYPPSSYIMEATAKYTTISGVADRWVGVLGFQSSIASGNTGYVAEYGSGRISIEKFTVTHLQIAGITYTPGNFYKIKGQFVSGNLKTVFEDGTTVSSSDTSFTSGYFGLRTFNAHASFKDVRVRKYASPEPTFGASGSEELNITAIDMNLDKTSCPGACTVNVFVQWYNYGHADIESFTPAILIDNTILAYGAPISIPSLGSTASGAIVTPTLTIGNHTICPYPN